VYNGIIGLNITTASYPGALFLSAGGYHHHIGVNTWQSNNGNPPPENSTGLIGFTININNPEYLKQVISEAEKAGLLANSPHKENTQGFTLLDFDRNKIQLT
jgi:catechol 2,3-dioxygenase